ncbi:mechanosensitive ion channel family protein [Saccharolobus solfataricus]|nr:mechanosensitive ion channel family protein [Saccharolobus solfataricus]AKA73897.2 mechanosensitive ion channel family protein [Saccharolobus solfataricus]AKA76595.2 mechanosensitive ion channel family protein [Saccharolobus solfataricus]AKA79288.2 mechanosensitive ion channel family protein [Saccharolobus solfataricus]AZF68374.1 mechanosensitive ion channel family protein [Saccharolobus solfataricus]AZF70994.1 mechanosensitive ion channel family protein [Saccharolobus solfataricus]
MSLRIAILLFLLFLAFSLGFVIQYFLQVFGITNQSTINSVIFYLRIALYVFIGLWIVSSISEAIRVYSQRRLGIRANVIANSVRYFGYVIVFLLVLLPLGVGSSTLIAGSTFAGLIIGLALQPVLSNFFAGLLIMLTGYIVVGDKIRVLSTQVPFFPAQFPAYKYFSTDFIEQGYKGTVVEIDLFYSRVLLENLRELRVPNIVLLNSAVLDYTSKYSEEHVINVRVEFPLAFIDINKLEDIVKEELKDFNVVEGPYINEQSDKDHVIVLARLKVGVSEDWRKIKSNALKRLLRLRQELIDKKSQDSQQTKIS